MYTNSSCTLYLKSNNYTPLYIDSCFITHRKIASASKQGMTYTESAFIMFKNFSLIFTEGKDFVIEGNTIIKVDATTEAKLSLSIKALLEAKAYTIMIADKKEYGSLNMRHWELSCK